MSERLPVTSDTTLMVHLTQKLEGWSRKKIKQRLGAGSVTVNGQAVTKHNHGLCTGDMVEVGALPKGGRLGPNQLEILYSDRDLVAINKPAGLLSVGTDKETKRHALAMLREQLSRPKRAVKFWPVHRLDRDTSGVLLFATSREMREAVSEGWGQAEKTYLAVVQGHPDPAQGTIDQPLRMDPKGFRVQVGSHPEAKQAVTHYATEKTVRKRTLLEVKLETGRQHQIRAHLAWLGCPVVGDSRYGIKGPRMGLHALRLSIVHPVSGKRLVFETPPPKEFLALLG